MHYPGNLGIKGGVWSPFLWMAALLSLHRSLWISLNRTQSIGWKDLSNSHLPWGLCTGCSICPSPIPGLSLPVFKTPRRGHHLREALLDSWSEVEPLTLLTHRGPFFSFSSLKLEIMYRLSVCSMSTPKSPEREIPWGQGLCPYPHQWILRVPQ